MRDSERERFILVLDKNPNHVAIIRRVLSGDEKKYHLEVIGDGHDALDFLHRREGYSEVALPDLILLDLNLPGRNGREILKEIKATPDLKRIPIVVLTISEREEDVLYSYAHQGNCYVVKSADLEELSSIVKRIEEFWLEIVTLPVE